MTRWKREFKAWCEREGMRVYAMPKKVEDWGAAKHLTRLMDYQVRQDDMERAFQTVMMYGTSTIIGRMY